MQEQIKQLAESRQRLHQESIDLLETAAKEERDLTDEEEVRFNKIDDEMASQKKQLDRFEAVAKRSGEFTEQAERYANLQFEESGKTTRTTTDEITEGTAKWNEERNKAFAAWGRGGLQNVPETHRRFLNLQQVDQEMIEGRIDVMPATSAPTINLRSKPLPFTYKGNGHWGYPEDTSYRAAQTVTTTAGGHVIEDESMAAIETALLEFGGMRQAGSEVLRTSTGASLPWPTINDTSNKGRLLAINTSVTNTALVYGQVVLGAYKYSSDSVLVPIELMQDSVFDYATHVAARLGERIGRITNEHFTTGTGSSEPDGVKNVANAAVKTVASASAITADELIELQGDLDNAYEDGAVWMWKKATQTVVRKLKDSNNNYLWAPGTGVGGLGFGTQDSFLGMPVVVNSEVYGIGADKRSVFYGNFRRGYKIRDVMGITLFRLNERYMDDGQFGFIAFSRHDGALVDAGTNPIVAIRHPAS